MSDYKRDVFISYHTSTAADQVRKIAAALEGAGISCWYAPRDCAPQFAEEIVRAIRGCRVFLLLLNTGSNQSEHCKNEIKCAFDHFVEQKDMVMLPFRLESCTLSEEVYYYVTRFHIMDGTLPPELQRIRELVDRIRILLGKAPEHRVTMALREGGSASYRIVGNIVYPDSHFMGREEDLNVIAQRLSGTENKLFLVGMGGIGKSEIAKKYLIIHREDYDVVVWMVYENSLMHTIADDHILAIKGICRQDYPEDSEREYFQRKLQILKENADRRLLLVIDNYDPVEEDRDLEAICAGEYSILFTTRHHHASVNIPEREVQPMETEAEWLGLFGAEYTRRLDEDGKAHVLKILRLLDGHPLSIRLIASVMQNRRIAPEKMLSMLRQGTAEMKTQNLRVAEMIYSRLRRVFQWAGLPKEEQYLLRNLSLLSMQGIAVETLFDWCDLNDFDVVEELIRKSWVIHDNVKDEVHLHPLIAEVMAETLEEDDSCCETLVNSLWQACQNKMLTYEQKCSLYAHVSVAATRISEKSALWELIANAQVELVRALGQPLEAARIYRQLMDWEQDPEKKLMYYGKIAHCHGAMGDAQSCLDIAKEAYDAVANIPIDQLTHGQGVEKVFLLHRMCESSRDLERYEDAVMYARECLMLAPHFARSTPQATMGWTEYHLSKSLLGLGNIAGAEAASLRSLEQFAQIDDKWSSSYVYDLLGKILQTEKDFEKALSYNQKAIDILLPAYGEDNVDVADFVYHRGQIYGAIGQAAEAKRCFDQARDVYVKKNCFKKQSLVEEDMEKLQ